MIETLHIKRFKSILDLSLACRRINVFIGEPNTGKSNILEALGMFSFAYYSQFGYDAKQFIRFERTSNLFYDETVEHPLEITCGPHLLQLSFGNSRFDGFCRTGERKVASLQGAWENLNASAKQEIGEIAQFKLYRFSSRIDFRRHETDCLMPPSGDNLASLLAGNRELRTTIGQPFLSFGLHLRTRPHEGKLEVIRHLDGIEIAYPYSIISDTLQRLTFHLAAILSNRESVLILEEPESHAFPYYTKYLAELIALDQRDNQYFISTHNPYFLLPLLAKARADSITVHVTYFEDYQTKVRTLEPSELEELGEIDVFSNLERYLRK